MFGCVVAVRLDDKMVSEWLLCVALHSEIVVYPTTVCVYLVSLLGFSGQPYACLSSRVMRKCQ